VDGAVSFTRLGPQVTQVLLVLEWPKGLFERPGNLWRARARRARLDLEQFRRQALAHVLVRQKEVRGWRGEIRDGAVVTTHEEALEQDRKAQEGMGPEQAAEEEEEVTPQEGVAEDESAADSTADEYAVGDQGEEDQVGEEQAEASRVQSAGMTDAGKGRNGRERRFTVPASGQAPLTR